MGNLERRKATFSTCFLLMAILFTVCLIASNLFETKVFVLGPLSLTGGLVIFPVSYIINDCMVEVWGYRKARLVIWTGFVMNFFVVLTAQLVRLLPAAPFWDGGEHFNYIFTLAPRITFASMLAFLSGSTVNALVMSKMKVRDNGRRFTARAILSTIAGESLDSLIFFPIAFWGMGIKEMLIIMAAQIVLKTLYEVMVLPITMLVVKKVKAHEGEDVYDREISYNPFKIGDVE